MNRINYQKKLDSLINQYINIEETQIEDGKKCPLGHLMLHSCCAPCSSYVLEYLSEYFEITVFYYNPNITSEREYRKRVEEQKRLISQMKCFFPVHFIEGPYEKERFMAMSKGLEKVPEGGKRCYLCYKMRLEKTAQMAKKMQSDYFTTTLSISPYKNAVWLNEIGEELAKLVEVAFLPSDFKKKNGYRRSIALSKEYDLYRQDYCGCIFSKLEMEEKRNQKIN